MEEEELIKCPLCDLTFRDKRGLTSHARNKHELEKEEVFEKIIEKEQEKKEWKIIKGIGAVLIALIGLAKLK